MVEKRCRNRCLGHLKRPGCRFRSSLKVILTLDGTKVGVWGSEKAKVFDVSQKSYFGQKRSENVVGSVVLAFWSPPEAMWDHSDSKDVGPNFYHREVGYVVIKGYMGYTVLSI